MGVIDCRGKGLLEAVEQTLSDIFIPAISKYKKWGDLSDDQDSKNRTKFLNSITGFVDSIASAQESLNEKVELSECQTVALSTLTTHALYIEAASSTETLELIEIQARQWIKEIEQVNVY